MYWQYRSNPRGLSSHSIASLQLSMPICTNEPDGFGSLFTRQRTDQCKACNQVAEALNSNQLVPPHIPHALLHSLMQTPSLLAALRSLVAGGNKPAGDLDFCSGSAVGSTLSCLRLLVQL